MLELKCHFPTIDSRRKSLTKETRDDFISNVRLKRDLKSAIDNATENNWREKSIYKRFMLLTVIFNLQKPNERSVAGRTMAFACTSIEYVLTMPVPSETAPMATTFINHVNKFKPVKITALNETLVQVEWETGENGRVAK